MLPNLLAILVLKPFDSQVCFRLYSQAQFDAFEPYPAPEIHRMPLDTMLLQMISMGLPDVRVFPFIEAPKSEQVEQTILALKQHVRNGIWISICIILILRPFPRANQNKGVTLSMRSENTIFFSLYVIGT